MAWSRGPRPTPVLITCKRRGGRSHIYLYEKGLSLYSPPAPACCSCEVRDESNNRFFNDEWSRVFNELYRERAPLARQAFGSTLGSSRHGSSRFLHLHLARSTELLTPSAGLPARPGRPVVRRTARCGHAAYRCASECARRPHPLRAHPSYYHLNDHPHTWPGCWGSGRAAAGAAAGTAAGTATWEHGGSDGSG